MFTRLVTITSRSGKTRELSRMVSEKVLPILKSQPGFVDEITLVSSDNPSHLIAISFWRSREDAERYSRESFSSITDLISGLVEGTPEVRTFDVEQSTIHKIATGKAA